jgi:F0F1-type ATP synthase membrane subunit c/vacuolar-type H+-ATPase subunit K
VGFIAVGAGVGVGVGARLTQRGAARAGPGVEACSGVARARRTRGRVNLPEFFACRAPKRANLAICLV